MVATALHALATQCLKGDEPEKRPTGDQCSEALWLAERFMAQHAEPELQPMQGAPMRLPIDTVRVMLEESASNPGSPLRFDKECLVCLEGIRGSNRIVPCGHCVACEACMEVLVECPLCRTPVESVEQGAFTHTYVGGPPLPARGPA